MHMCRTLAKPGTISVASRPGTTNTYRRARHARPTTRPQKRVVLFMLSPLFSRCQSRENISIFSTIKDSLLRRAGAQPRPLRRPRQAGTSAAAVERPCDLLLPFGTDTSGHAWLRYVRAGRHGIGRERRQPVACVVGIEGAPGVRHVKRRQLPTRKFTPSNNGRVSTGAADNDVDHGPMQVLAWRSFALCDLAAERKAGPLQISEVMERRPEGVAGSVAERREQLAPAESEKARGTSAAAYRETPRTHPREDARGRLRLRTRPILPVGSAWWLSLDDVEALLAREVKRQWH